MCGLGENPMDKHTKMISMMPQLIYFLTLILSISCEDTANLINGRFKTNPCAESGMQTIVRVIPETTTKSTSAIHCAALCHRNDRCKYAVFNSGSRKCEQIFGLTNVFRSISHQSLFDDSNVICTVLTKVLTELWVRFEIAQLVTLDSYEYFSDLKFGTRFNNRYTHQAISEFYVGQTGKFSAASYGKTLAIAYPISTGARVSSPFRTKLKYVCGDANAATRQTVNINFGDTLTPGTTTTPHNDYVVRKHIRLDSDVMLANNLTELNKALLNGYRRLTRQQTKINFAWPETEVQYDVIEVSALPAAGFQPTSYFFKYIKEVVREDNTGTTYTFKYKILRDGEGLHDERSTSNVFPWVMETSWYEIEHLNQELVDVFRQGKPVRMVMSENTINTDIIAAYIDPSIGNIMVANTPYGNPRKGPDMVATTNRRIRHPLFETLTSNIARCDTESMKSGSVVATNVKNAGPTRWFVSSKTWDRLLVIDQANNVVSGDLPSLSGAVLDGKNIRACVEEASGVFYCLHPQYISADLDAAVTFQSYPFINPFETFNSNPIECTQQNIMIISSNAWVETVQFSVGVADTAPVRLAFEKISWFAEQN